MTKIKISFKEMDVLKKKQGTWLKVSQYLNVTERAIQMFRRRNKAK